ncbi:helix-turn-helix transcriptional regulator [Streptomyces sp. CA-142005]|uniref:helix-turn-helix transcriptional regulator n=1 Tax=Streptomyces sp. CA-142005 TaxID=3240052 RepID=UPI003D89E13C
MTVVVAQRFIDDNLESFDLNPASVAKAISVSLRTLHRSFSSAGMSVMGYVRMRRIQEARKDLLEYGSSISVSELAAKWRFSDASHFIRHFKQVYGASPVSYARNYRAKHQP